MVRWILMHPDFDLPLCKGKVMFDLGRKPGSGEPAVTATFHPVGEAI